MRTCLPTQTTHTHIWEGGDASSLRMRAVGASASPTEPSAAAVADSPAGPVSPVKYSSHFGQMIPRLLKQLCLLALVIFCSSGSYWLISHFLMSSVEVQGRSMLPTLQDGDRYVLNRWVYHCKQPQRGDLVVIRDPGHNDFAVKRIVALPCESVYVRSGLVYVNNQKLEEPYLSPGTATPAFATKEKWLVIGQQRYFVMGDNRAESEDSRIYGTIHRNDIIGCIIK